MPNEVIAQVHHLAFVAEKYDSIVFTNMDGNILSEQFTEDADNENSTENMENITINKQQPQKAEAIEDETEADN